MTSWERKTFHFRFLPWFSPSLPSWCPLLLLTLGIRPLLHILVFLFLFLFHLLLPLLPSLLPPLNLIFKPIVPSVSLLFHLLQIPISLHVDTYFVLNALRDMSIESEVCVRYAGKSNEREREREGPRIETRIKMVNKNSMSLDPFLSIFCAQSDHSWNARPSLRSLL